MFDNFRGHTYSLPALVKERGFAGAVWVRNESDRFYPWGSDMGFFLDMVSIGLHSRKGYAR